MDLNLKQNLQVLFVCSGNHSSIPPFILEQKTELEKKGVKVDLFTIRGKGILGYLKNYAAFVKKLRSNSYHLVHAHFGLSGLLANLQRGVPVVTTFHGCDLNVQKNRSYSGYAARLSKEVIVVSDRMSPFLNRTIPREIIPCGIDMEFFRPINQDEARAELIKAGKRSFKKEKKYILFASTFRREVKNPELAKKAVALLGEGYELIELANLSRTEVMLMMNASDVMLMTSKTEGSPQFIKEAMACNRPIVTTNVGDVEEIINGADGCFITDPVAEEVAANLRKALQYKNTNGRTTIGDRYNNEKLVNRILHLYEKLE